MNTNMNVPEENQTADNQPERESGGNAAMRNKIIIGVGIVVIIILGVWMFAGNGDEQEAVPNISEEEVIEENRDMPEVSAGGRGVLAPTTEARGESVSVSDQPAGETVLVDAISITSPSWVVVREEGWILGARRVDESGSEISVPLLRATEAGGSYEVVIYIDDGDRQFDHLKDMLVEGVVAPFLAL